MTSPSSSRLSACWIATITKRIWRSSLLQTVCWRGTPLSSLLQRILRSSHSVCLISRTTFCKRIISDHRYCKKSWTSGRRRITRMRWVPFLTSLCCTWRFGKWAASTRYLRRDSGTCQPINSFARLSRQRTTSRNRSWLMPSAWSSRPPSLSLQSSLPPSRFNWRWECMTNKMVRKHAHRVIWKICQS